MVPVSARQEPQVSKVRHVDYYPDEFITGVGGVLTAEQIGVY